MIVDLLLRVPATIPLVVECQSSPINRRQRVMSTVILFVPGVQEHVQLAHWCFFDITWIQSVTSNAQQVPIEIMLPSHPIFENLVHVRVSQILEHGGNSELWKSSLAGARLVQ